MAAGAHEIGHTLMNVPKGEGSEHAATGVMTKSISDEEIRLPRPRCHLAHLAPMMVSLTIQHPEIS